MQSASIAATGLDSLYGKIPYILHTFYIYNMLIMHSSYTALHLQVLLLLIVVMYEYITYSEHTIYNIHLPMCVLQYSDYTDIVILIIILIILVYGVVLIEEYVELLL